MREAFEAATGLTDDVAIAEAAGTEKAERRDVVQDADGRAQSRERVHERCRERGESCMKEDDVRPGPLDGGFETGVQARGLPRCEAARDVITEAKPGDLVAGIA